MQEVIPHMRRQRGGRIVNVSSKGGQVAYPALGAYCASKWALEGLSEALRYELAPFGIAVVIVEPGAYKTEIAGKNMVKAAAGGKPDSPYAGRSDRMTKLIVDSVTKSRSDPGDVARLIVRIVRAKRPRLRYRIGWDAHADVLGKATLPERLFEGLMMQVTR